MRKRVLVCMVYSGMLYAGPIEWKDITVNHFWTIFDTTNVGDTVNARLIGAEEGLYQLTNRSSTGISEYEYHFFIPHPGPGHPIRVLTRQTMYGKRPIPEAMGQDSKELKEYIAGSVYNTIEINSPIIIEGTKYTVVDQYEHIDNNIICILSCDEGKQKTLTLEHKNDVGNVYSSCEDRQPDHNQELEMLDEEVNFPHRCCGSIFYLMNLFLKKLSNNNE